MVFWEITRIWLILEEILHRLDMWRVVLVFAAGQSRQTASDGKSTDMTITTQVQDLAAVKNFILQQTYADAERLVLLGVSQGGFVSGLAAAADPDMVKKLIMIFPALCIPDDARRGRLAQQL